MAKVIVNRQSRSTLLLSISHELRTKQYWLVSENCSFAWRACMKSLDETKGSETRDETPRPFGPRPRRDRDVEQFVQDETEARRYYVSRRSPDRDVETKTTSLNANPNPNHMGQYSWPS